MSVVRAWKYIFPVIFFFSFFVCFQSEAQVLFDTRLHVPDKSSNGRYWVKWNPGEYRLSLQQSTDGVDWRTIYTGFKGKKRIISKVNGTYFYRIHVSLDTQGLNTNELDTLLSFYSEPQTVSVLLDRPGKPVSISTPVSSDNGLIAVSWGAANGVITQYQLDQQRDNGQWVNIYNGERFSKAMNVDDGSYRYRVRGCNEKCGPYQFSSTTDVALKPGVPASIRSPNINDNGVFTVSWMPGSGDIDYYELYQYRLNDYSRTDIYSGPLLSATISGLNNDLYYYGIRACNSQGHFSVCSGYLYGSTVEVKLLPELPNGMESISVEPNSLFSASR